jgi:hypothetical protein
MFPMMNERQIIPTILDKIFTKKGIVKVGRTLIDFPP